MKSTLLKIYPLIIALLLVYVFILKECTHPKEQTPQVITTSDTITKDSIIVIDNTKHYPKPIPDTVYYPDSIFTHPTGTANFNFVNKYNLKLDFGISGTADFITTVYQNQIQEYSIKSHLKTYTTTKTITNTITPKIRNHVYGGGIISYSETSMGLTPTLILQTKKNNLYGIGYDPLNKVYMAHVYFKIF